MVRHAVWVSILISLFASTSRIMRMKAVVMVSFRRVAMIFEGELDYLTGVKDICGGLR